MDAEMNIQSGLSNENMSTWAEVDGAATQLKINIPEKLRSILIINGFSSLRLIAEMTSRYFQYRNILKGKFEGYYIL